MTFGHVIRHSPDVNVIRVQDATDGFLQFREVGDTFNRLAIFPDGTIKAGDGTAVPTRVVTPTSGTTVDIVEIFTAGAPVNGTTGATIAGVGSRYTDITAGKLYINTNTKASPTWTVVGSQS